ncbi:MAG: formylglycine-generating enzyme family protein [Gallionella sp.]|nr:formylglycine-generating enzyme family protein [Gallionella sp.]
MTHLSDETGERHERRSGGRTDRRQANRSDSEAYTGFERRLSDRPCRRQGRAPSDDQVKSRRFVKEVLFFLIVVLSVVVYKNFYSVPDKPISSVSEDNETALTGKFFRDCPSCPRMTIISAGSFEMGSNDGLNEEKPVHIVTISQAFAMSKTEVTQGQWKALMGDNPSKFTVCGDNCPVEQVSWEDAQAFIQKLNAKTGKQYRLPSEAEWEYACRAGGHHVYCGSDNLDVVGWYGASVAGWDDPTKRAPGNSNMITNPAGRKQANAFGLYDMSGNVWEWVEDNYHDNYNGAPADGSAWQGDSTKRVLRGGSWFYGPSYARSTRRLMDAPELHNDSVGFRLARTLP